MSYPEGYTVKSWRIGSLSICAIWRSSRRPCGRFGGGCQWKFGIQAGSGRTTMSVFVMDIRLEWHK